MRGFQSCEVQNSKIAGNACLMCLLCFLNFDQPKMPKRLKENPYIKQKQKKGKGDLPSSLRAGAPSLPKPLHDEALDNQIAQPS